ncbi:tetratricopeptide repeat protein [Streptomyces sp. NPDC050560]|uniref:transglutaminase family protein n=1 Tax=Streptomyces sp. NPDC050560 TaxID=3365630 RepID=UPI0037AC9EBE
MSSPEPPRPAGPEQDAEWRRQFAAEARSERPDLSRLCLLLGAVADASLTAEGIDAAQIELDRLAGEVPYRPGGPEAWARAVGTLLGGRYGFHGTPADYRSVASSLLHRVLTGRRGLPILLSVVWEEVARRAGAPVFGVALPGRFLVGFGEPGEGVFADPFEGGGIVDRDGARRLVAESTGAEIPLDATAFEPAGPLDVVLRVLNNIRAWAGARPEHSAVALWAVELSLLLPSHPAALRQERGEVLIGRGEFLTGAAELDAYAELVEVVDEAGAERVRAKAREARAMLN